MNLTLAQIPDHNFRIIVVPGEFIKHPVSDYKNIIIDKKKYAIYDEIIHNKGDRWGTALPLLAAGSFFSEKDVFDKYVNSDRIIFFICKKINS